MWAASYLVEGKTTTVLLLPSVDVFFCRYLLQCLQREWTTAIALCTSEDCTDIVQSELGNEKERVLYVHRQNISAQGYYAFSEKGHLAICGPLDTPKQFCQYHYLCNGSRVPFITMMQEIISLFTTKIKNISSYSTPIQNFLNRKL